MTTPKRASTRSGTEKDPRRRIHKILSAAGVCSLREAERLIDEGRVTVNGKTVTEKGSSADPEKDAIRVDGKIVKTFAPPVYIALHKPKGYVTTRSDERGRKTVMELLPKELSSLYPVGRLDIMSEGLLLFTNDGDFAQAVMAPKNRIKRVYKVKVRNIPDAKAMAKMTSGLTIRGEKLRFAAVEKIGRTGRNAWLKVTLTEGRKRHIRRLLEALGHPVAKLKRVSIGPIILGDLKPGEARHVKKELVNKIMKSAGKK
ncbi:MAG: pseudouridine synthase [Candidatus Nitrospinota bacterium M3_3B_026]